MSLGHPEKRKLIEILAENGSSSAEEGISSLQASLLGSVHFQSSPPIQIKKLAVTSTNHPVTPNNSPVKTTFSPKK